MLQATWHLRRRTAARAVRLGYNVMVVDSDMIIFDDPYALFKSPPFSQVQLLIAVSAVWLQHEVFWDKLQTFSCASAMSARVQGRKMIDE